MARRGGFTIGRGAASLEVSGELTRAVEQVIRELAPTVVAVVEREVEALTAKAEEQWPRGDEKDRPRITVREDGTIRSNAPRNRRQPYHSQDRFITGIRYVGDGIEGYIDNDAPTRRGQRYWWFIKTGPKGREFSPLQRYIRQPLRIISQQLAEELAADLKKMIREA